MKATQSARSRQTSCIPHASLAPREAETEEAFFSCGPGRKAPPTPLSADRLLSTERRENFWTLWDLAKVIRTNAVQKGGK